ncbi:maintenance of telomere capping protein 1 [Trichomonascus vanleenenianus]|uniref:DUF5427 domain-containing protein MTC1 n=1 Tax=Trichomonascus vanleenenianus TaxID=2268995 RepID=UPI003ECAD6D6
MAEDKRESTEDVLQLLDSLDKGGKKKGKGELRKKASGKKGEDEDIMGFLDSLTKSNANSGRSTPKVEESAKEVTSKEPSKKEGESDKSVDKSGEQPVVKSEEPVVKSEEPVAKSLEPQGPKEDRGVSPTNVTEPLAAPSQPQEAPSQPQEDLPDPIGAISSWWSKNKGGIWDSATNAVKQAEARVRELQPEVQQRTNALENFSKLGGGFLKNTFSSVLDTIAPPISRHEQLKIHIFHDMVGFGAVDPIVYNVFERVMQQVEGGGELQMVFQKGKERHRRGSNVGHPDLNLFRGELEQAQKLAKANVEEFMTKPTTEQEKPTENKVEGEEEKPVRTSDIFLSIQPIAAVEPEASNTLVPDSPSTFSFVMYLADPDHEIEFYTVSQAFPYQWAEWLSSTDNRFAGLDADPREWVVEWIEDGIGLAVGIVAQSYVARRMGVDRESS